MSEGRQFGIFRIGDRLQPFVAGSLLGYGQGQVGKSFAGYGPVPVFNFRGDVDKIAGRQVTGRLAPLLVPAVAPYADQHLSGHMVGMPVVATAGLKGNVTDDTFLVIQQA